jgi:hypothetical protein
MGRGGAEHAGARANFFKTPVGKATMGLLTVLAIGEGLSACVGSDGTKYWTGNYQNSDGTITDSRNFGAARSKPCPTSERYTYQTDDNNFKKTTTITLHLTSCDDPPAPQIKTKKPYFRDAPRYNRRTGSIYFQPRRG